jgi:Domain of unknown function (DUF5134)
MTGPSWLGGMFAAVMIVTAGYSASRLVIFRARGRVTELDADALHVVMGVAMAGMLVPRLSVLPASAWAAVFGIGAVWFGWHAILPRGLRTADGARCRFPVPHLIECIAMLYMLLPLPGSHPAPGRTGMAMAAMSSSAGTAGSFPALAVVLALFMVGYIVWTTDRLTALARASTTAARTGRNRARQSSLTVLAAAAARGADGSPGSPAAAAVVPQGEQNGRPVLAPKLAACGKIAMGITMGYMLILML